eukprot:403350831
MLSPTSQLSTSTASEICNSCNTPFNQMEHHIVMLPCGDFLCLQCFNKNFDAKENKITCPFDQETLNIPAKMRENINTLKMRANTLWVSCDAHSENQAECYCRQHKTMVCHKCALQLHSEHKNSITDVKMRDVEIYFESAVDKLTTFKNRIEDVLKFINMFQHREKSFSSQQFMDIIEQIQDILTPHLMTQEEKQSISFLSDLEQPISTLQQQQTNPPSMISPTRQSTLHNKPGQPPHLQSHLQPNVQQQKQVHPPSHQQFYTQSQQQNPSSHHEKPLVNQNANVAMFQEFDFGTQVGALETHTKQAFKISDAETKLLADWLGSQPTYELLYRGTRDGFDSQKFHQKVDGKGPTITIIKSEQNKVFGGYTQIPWSSQPKFLQDDKAFLFSLTHRSIHKPYQNFQQSIIHDKGMLSAFGGDLQIHSDCNSYNQESFSMLGSTYSLPAGVIQRSQEANTYLAGSQNFRVQEIEVYKVTL